MAGQDKTQFICTRPKLAALLRENGIKMTSIANPWKPQYSAWKCDVTEKSANIIAKYYKSIGKEPPAVIAKALGLRRGATL